MNRFEHEMNKSFQKLGLEIIPSDDDLKKMNIFATKAIELLQKKSKYCITNVLIAGSAGKKTTIIGSDIDCVVFINGVLPPFKDILDEFDDILNMSDSYGINDFHTTRYSIQFKMFDFNFDLLPAVNFDKCLQGDELINYQHQKTLEKIRENPKKNGYMYSSSMADSVVRWMKQQDGFVNEMVRIAKFWYKTLYMPDYISGAKNCIELIAVYAAKEEDRMQQKSYLRSFKRFIRYLCEFRNLNIIFDENDVFYRNPPRVIDPMNPYNNLVNNWDEKSISLITMYANETDRRLDWLASAHSTRLDQLFEPQPTYRVDIAKMLKIDPTKSHWLVNTVHYNSLPDLKIRNEIFHKDVGLQQGLEKLKIHFQFLIFAVKASSTNCDANQFKEAIKNSISKQILNKNPEWTSTTENHEDYDVTLTIPFLAEEALRISYRL